MSRKVKATKYVFYCEKCDMWYDSNEVIAICSRCGLPVRELDKYERNDFYCRIARSGYTVIDEEFEKKQVKGK